MGWHIIKDEHIRLVWGRTCDCEYQDETYFMDLDSLIEGGIAACPECGDDLEYSGAQVRRRKEG